MSDWKDCDEAREELEAIEIALDDVRQEMEHGRFTEEEWESLEREEQRLEIRGVDVHHYLEENCRDGA